MVPAKARGQASTAVSLPAREPLAAARPSLEPSPPRSVFYFQTPWITAVNVSLKPVFPCHGLLFSLCVSLTPENGN